MQKVLLAVGFKQLEDYLIRTLKNEFIFVGQTVYREGIIRAIGQKSPDIVVIRETLEGNENILQIIYDIRSLYPKIRIVYLAGKRQQGDELLATLVGYGVYDILVGGNIKADAVVALIRNPNGYTDVKHYQPVPVLDEKNNKVLFTPPAPEVIVVERDPASVDGKEPQSTDNVPREKVFTLPSSDNVPTEKKDVEPPRSSLLDKFIAKPSPSPAPRSGIVTKQKIVTFMGSVGGVGCSSIAFSTALLVAQKGFRTIFVEFDEKTPLISFLYEIGHFGTGIDTALMGIQEEDHDKINEAIIRTTELKKTDDIMVKNYKKFPNTLDFMFFSTRYLTKDETDEMFEPIDMGLTEKLFLHLLFKAEYDFVILAVPNDIAHDATRNALMYSNRIFMTVTQDVCSIGYSLRKVEEMNRRKIQTKDKLYYVINKFDESRLSLKDIIDWLKNKNVLTVPCLNKDFVNANYLGMPVALYSRNPLLRNSLQEIEKTII